MIKSVTIDIINDMALKLLYDLELLQLIRVRKENIETKQVDWELQYKGAMSKQSPSDIEDQIDELRSGWE